MYIWAILKRCTRRGYCSYMDLPQIVIYGDALGLWSSTWTTQWNNLGNLKTKQNYSSRNGNLIDLDNGIFLKSSKVIILRSQCWKSQLEAIFYQHGYNWLNYFFKGEQNHIIWGHTYHHILLIQVKQLDPKETFHGMMLHQLEGDLLPKDYISGGPQF